MGHGKFICPSCAVQLRQALIRSLRKDPRQTFGRLYTTNDTNRHVPYVTASSSNSLASISIRTRPSRLTNATLKSPRRGLGLSATQSLAKKPATRTRPSVSRGGWRSPQSFVGYIEAPIRQYLRTFIPEELDQDQPDATTIEESFHGNEALIHHGRKPIEYSQEDDHESAEDGLEDQPDLGGFNRRFLAPGDVVLLAKANDGMPPRMACFVQMIAAGQDDLYYSSSGRLITASENDILACAPSHIPLHLVNALRSCLPETIDQTIEHSLLRTDMPRLSGAPIISRMLSLHRECDQLFREHRTRLDNLPDLIIGGSELRMTWSSLKELASVAFEMDPKDLTPTHVFTTTIAVRDADLAFRYFNRTMRLGGPVCIQSKKFRNNFLRCRKMLRSIQEQSLQKMSSPLGKNFKDLIVGAKTVIRHNRQLQATEAKSDASPERGNRMKYTISDSEHKYIIDMMFAWSCSGALEKSRIASCLPAFVLHATGMYRDQALTRRTGVRFLQEIGLVSPFAHRISYDERFTQYYTKVERSRWQSSEELHDGMQTLRHDWAKLPVFCIDGPGAHEIDDGISIEEPDEQNRSWVHIHVANPTAHMTKDSPLIADTISTIYFAEHPVRLLPEKLTSATLGLAPDRPCLTFSARLDGDGQLIDYKVSPGIVRKVRSLTYDQVNRLLGRSDQAGDDELPATASRVDKRSSSETDTDARAAGPEVSEQERIQIGRLQALAEKRFTKSHPTWPLQVVSKPRAMFQFQSVDALKFPAPSEDKSGETGAMSEPSSASKYDNSTASKYQPRELLVSEMMVLAGEVAARWCAERNVPIIYRGTEPIPEDVWTMWKESVWSSREQGDAPRYPYYAVCSTRPARHHMIGVDAYTRATSPLRRYNDMITHWQIEAALRKEAELGRSLVGLEQAELNNIFPFSRKDIELVKDQILFREKTNDWASKQAQRALACQILARALKEKRAGLPETFEGVVSRSINRSRNSMSIVLTQYDLPALMLYSDDELAQIESVKGRKTKVGDKVHVKIDEIDTFMGQIFVRPTKVPPKCRRQ